ncbi:hypothetical protein RB653_000183 [Dictyostelium firmibasis]|uniref:Deacetylase sirtuin-type domain-containing protein n=1 Tax=Dictyostelium firmibasis TaxID=79012 RepID=A0AAN7U6Q2_9MYCE
MIQQIKKFLYDSLSLLAFPLFYLRWAIGNTYQSKNNNLKEEPKPPQYPKEWSDLFIHSYNNEHEKVLEILQREPNSINSVDSLNWTLLHVAVSHKSIDVVNLLLEKNIEISIKNNKGYTAFHIAACNGDLDIIEKMISMNRVPNGNIISNDMETSLFLSITNNHFGIAESILNYYHSNMIGSDNNNEKKNEFKKMIDQFNVHGVSPLLMSVLRKNLMMIKKLIEMGADINSFKKDNSTALHCAAIIDFTEAIEYLLNKGGIEMMNSVNRYGNSPIHEAAIKGNFKSIQTFIKQLKIINENEQKQLFLEIIDKKDKDGSTPLHLCCNCVNSNNIENNLKSCKVLIEEGGVDVNGVDSGNATALHILACVSGDLSLPLVKYFLEVGCDPTIENRYGWTAIHQAYHNKNIQVYQLLLDHLKSKNPTYNLDIEKKRVFPSSLNNSNNNNNNNNNNDSSLNNSEELKLKGIERLKNVIKDIKDGKIKNAIVLSGAGISANAGIPPYRTKDGLLAKNKQFSFSMELLEKHPDVFYEAIRDHFYPIHKASNENDREDGISAGIKSTTSHYFINELNEKHGCLLRNYTQNVDPLQERTGTPLEKIIHAHGSFDQWYCTVCQKQYTDKSDRIWREIGRGGLPFCTVPECRHVIRPAVVFFGEPLSQDFRVNTITDFRKADLLIVMGTSLIVYPFASLVNDVASDVPRILFNFESTGPFVNTNDLNRKEKLKQEESLNNNNDNNNDELIVEARGNRDVVILGDCDKGVNYFNSLFNSI